MQNSTPKLFPALANSARLWMVNYVNDLLHKQNHGKPKGPQAFPDDPGLGAVNFMHDLMESIIHFEPGGVQAFIS